MRWQWTVAAWVAWAVVPATAADPGAGKAAFSDESVIGACGGSVADMFARFGVPQDVVAARGQTAEEDDVLVDYGEILFRTRDQKVRCCFFLKSWKSTIRGIRIGDSREAVTQVLGKPQHIIRSKDHVETDYGYDLRQPKLSLWANFDKDGHVRRVEIALPD